MYAALLHAARFSNAAYVPRTAFTATRIYRLPALQPTPQISYHAGCLYRTYRTLRALGLPAAAFTALRLWDAVYSARALPGARISLLSFA